MISLDLLCIFITAPLLPDLNVYVWFQPSHRFLEMQCNLLVKKIWHLWTSCYAMLGYLLLKKINRYVYIMKLSVTLRLSKRYTFLKPRSGFFLDPIPNAHFSCIFPCISLSTRSLHAARCSKLSASLLGALDSVHNSLSSTTIGQFATCPERDGGPSLYRDTATSLTTRKSPAPPAPILGRAFVSHPWTSGICKFVLYGARFGSLR